MSRRPNLWRDYFEALVGLNNSVMSDWYPFQKEECNTPGVDFLCDCNKDELYNIANFLLISVIEPTQDYKDYKEEEFVSDDQVIFSILDRIENNSLKDLRMYKRIIDNLSVFGYEIELTDNFKFDVIDKLMMDITIWFDDSEHLYDMLSYLSKNQTKIYRRWLLEDNSYITFSEYIQKIRAWENYSSSNDYTISFKDWLFQYGFYDDYLEIFWTRKGVI